MNTVCRPPGVQSARVTCAPLLDFFFDRDLEGAEELLVEGRHLERGRLGALDAYVERRDVRRRLLAPGVAETDRGLQHQGDLVAFGADAVQAVRDLRRFGQRALESR